MNNDKMRYELKLRQQIPGVQRKDKRPVKKNLKDRLLNKSIVSVIALIAVMSLKMSAAPEASSALEKLEYLIKAQVDYSAMGQSALESFNGFMDAIDKTKDETASAPLIVMNAPLSEGKITQRFEKGVHPIYSTATAPVGVKIATTSGAFVTCGANGVLSAKTENADGTFRVSLLCDDEVNLVYDNLSVCYFNVDDKLMGGQIIGALAPLVAENGEAYSELSFSVYIKGEASDPLEYLGGVYGE